MNFLHWNMRDSQYGFQALSNRYRILTGENPSYEIPLDKRINLAGLLYDYYGFNYVDDPKIENIVKLNPKIKPKDMLNGLQEAQAFEDGKYNAVHKSTLSKVRLFNDILIMVSDRKLKVSNSKLKAFGYSPQVIFEMVRDKWWWGILSFIFGLILGKVI